LKKLQEMDNRDYGYHMEGERGRRHFRFEQRMSRRRGGRGWTGFFLLIVGALLLARQAGVYFPDWFFSWKVFLIGIGLLIGVRHKFRGFGWAIPILIGFIGLIDEIEDFHLHLRPYLWPAILIFIGGWIMLRPRRNYKWDRPFDERQPAVDPAAPAPAAGEEFADHGDQLDVSAIFGGVKKNVLSKAFRGGEITTFMGGAEINLLQADFQGRVRIDCSNVFGGTKLIIPADWEIHSDIIAMFGGVDDKRPPAPVPAPNKVLVLDGTCVFGGVEIRSY
jgi:hypothetical protein